MVIGYSSVELFLPGITSLKEKRRIIRSIKDRIKKNFNVAISEVDFLDKWQRTLLGVVSVSNDSKYLESMLMKVVEEIRNKRNINILNYTIRVDNGIKTEKSQFTFDENSF